MVDIVLLGPPGAGKGTQGERLARWLGVPKVSSGELFREAMDKETHLGLVSRKYVERGMYVPDEVTISMVAERLGRPDCAAGVILDGFPRTLAQAEALTAILKRMGRRIDVAILIGVSRDEAVRRLSGRWTCPDCGAVYHQVHSPERAKGLCDACGGALQRRGDDAPEVQEQRLAVYLEKTAPILEYYREQGVLVEIDGDGDVAHVQCALREVVVEAARGGGEQS